MAHLTQQGPSRNTNNIQTWEKARSRCWCFTINNYKLEDIESIQLAGGEYVFQEETGESGTKHLQGLLTFTNPMRLSSMKKINGKAHWEVCKNKIASIKYCTKPESRTGKIFTNMKKLENIGTGHSRARPIEKKVINFNEVARMIEDYDVANGFELDGLDEFFNHPMNRDMFRPLNFENLQEEDG